MWSIGLKISADAVWLPLKHQQAALISHWISSILDLLRSGCEKAPSAKMLWIIQTSLPSAGVASRMGLNTQDMKSTLIRFFRHSLFGCKLIHWKDWCWSWNSDSLATWCEELTHLKRSWCWERSKIGGEGDDRGWDGWMASLTQWTWVWVSSGSWWWTGKPGVLQSMGSQRVRHNWVTELNWTIWLQRSVALWR